MKILRRDKFSMFAKKSVIVLILTCVSVNSTNAVDNEYIKHFRKFSDDLISGAKETTEATEIKPGVHMFNPFGIGILLAHINEKVWNVPTKGIPEALHTQKKAVAAEYAQLLRQFRRVIQIFLNNFFNSSKVSNVCFFYSETIQDIKYCVLKIWKLDKTHGF